MAHLLVRHSLNPDVVVKFNVTVKQFTITTSDGDAKWLLEVGTGHLDKDGYNIRPTYVHLTTLDSLDQELERVIADMCLLIDWGVLVADGAPPYVSEHSPTGNDVSILSKIRIKIKEELPSSGIDLSEAKVYLNTGMRIFDITDDIVIKGDPYEYKIEWQTPLRVYNTYGE